MTAGQAMILTARVPGAEIAGEGAEASCLDLTARLEIVADTGGCLLLHYDRLGYGTYDNWFVSANQAKEVVQEWFGIAPSDWRTRTQDETPILLSLIKRHFAFLTDEYGFTVSAEHDSGLEYATADCLVTIGASGIRLESRERGIIRRRRVELLALVLQANPGFSLPPLPDDPRVALRDRDGSQDRRLALLASVLREHADKILRGDFNGRPSIAQGQRAMTKADESEPE